METLGVTPPDYEPRATDHISEIIALIRTLMEKGVAYEVEGDVFFSVEKFPAYGSLSGRSLEEMQAGVRIEVDPRKHHPMDFALWKKAKPGEPVWDSPWGPGRPGWHIECSAMSSRYLGETFDIHGGGKDLIFPHHENELAQSLAAFERPLARYWVHNGFVTIGGEKMSKSLGNFVTVREMIGKYHPEAIRLLLLSRHYRSPLDYSDQAMIEAQSGLRRLYTLLKDLEGPENRIQNKGQEPLTPERRDELNSVIERFREKAEEALDDDFNTAQAWATCMKRRGSSTVLWTPCGRKTCRPFPPSSSGRRNLSASTGGSWACSTTRLKSSLIRKGKGSSRTWELPWKKWRR